MSDDPTDEDDILPNDASSQGEDQIPEDITPEDYEPTPIEEMPLLPGSVKREDDNPPKEEEETEETPTEQVPKTVPAAPEGTKIRSIWPLLFTVLTIGILLGGTLTYFIVPKEATSVIKQPSQQTTTTSKTRFIPDKGLGAYSNVGIARSLTADRIQKAEKGIIWVTTFPDDQTILRTFRSIKAQTNIPIVIIAGNATHPRSWRDAIKEFPVFRSNNDLEEPTSIILIDDEIVIDASKYRSVWESVNPQIVKEASTWASRLLENSNVITK